MYTCRYCGSTFTRSDNLSRHILSSHSRVSTDAEIPGSNQTSEEFKFLHPFTCVLAGPSGCGKTTLLKEILEYSRIQPAPARIIWCYKLWQPMYHKMTETIPTIQFKQGLPGPPAYSPFPVVYVIDDLMADAAGNDTVCSMFTEGAHHLNLSVFFITQNLYYQSKYNRSMQLNTSYVVLFKSPRNNLQPAILARDMYPNNWREFMRKYQAATTKPYGYLLVDLKQETPEDGRLVTDITNKPSKIITASPNNPDIESVTPHQTAEIWKQTMDTSLPQQYQAQQYQEQPNFARTNELPNATQKERVYACEDCGAVFVDEESKEKHMESCSANEMTDDTRGWGVLISDEDGEDVAEKVLKTYKNMLMRWYALERSELHRNIAEFIEYLMKKRKMCIRDAVQKALKENNEALVELLEETEDGMQEDEDETD